jgi:hypothetical protein
MPPAEAASGSPSSGVEAPPTSSVKFEVPWLQSCYDRVAYPNKKCEAVLSEVNRGLRSEMHGMKQPPKC